MTGGSLHGQLDARFEPLRDVLEDSLASGAECGLSLAVDIDGQTVADVWGGFADEARSRPWERDTIVNVWSTTKTVTSLAVLMLADGAWWTWTLRSRATGRSSPLRARRASSSGT